MYKGIGKRIKEGQEMKIEEVIKRGERNRDYLDVLESMRKNKIPCPECFGNGCRICFGTGKIDDDIKIAYAPVPKPAVDVDFVHSRRFTDAQAANKIKQKKKRAADKIKQQKKRMKLAEKAERDKQRNQRMKDIQEKFTLVRKTSDEEITGDIKC